MLEHEVSTARERAMAFEQAARGIRSIYHICPNVDPYETVIGAFAITSDPILIALGLGLIGAMFVRAITVFLVRQGTLSEYEYLEHGAFWAIGALAVILLITIGIHVDEVISGLVGVAFIGAAFISSVVRNRRKPVEADEAMVSEAAV